MTKQTPLTRLALAAITVLVSSSALAQTRELGSNGTLLDGIAAIVDEGIVLKSELSARLELVIDSVRAQQAQLPPEQRPQLPPLSVLEQQVLDQLIVQQVQLQRADRVGITIGDDRLNEALARVAEGLNITLADLPNALAEENIDYTMYREDSRQEMIIAQLEQRDVIAQISVTPRELDQCLIRTEANESSGFDYNISHILLGVPAAATGEEIADAERRMEEIVARLNAGEDFSQLALTYSEGATALEGGSLGWRKGSELPTLFATAIPSMQAGDFSAPIKSESGLHIVRLNDMRGVERLMEDQIHVRHILITPNEVMDNDATQQRLRGLRDQIIGGDEFGTVALNVSEDTVSAADGGDLGWVGPGAFVPEFEEKLATLPLGELSEPFETRYGWHLAEVINIRSYDTTDEVKERRCASEIRTSKAEEEKELWLRRLRDQAFIDIRL